jgi:hypothetical protein
MSFKRGQIKEMVAKMLDVVVLVVDLKGDSHDCYKKGQCISRSGTQLMKEECKPLTLTQPTWYFNFRATKHIIGDVRTPNHMKNHVKTMKVRFAWGRFHFVQGKGDHFLVSYDGKVKQIHDIFCVIRVRKELFFVGAIINMMMSCGFWHDQYCWVVNSHDPIKFLVKG